MPIMSTKPVPDECLDIGLEQEYMCPVYWRSLPDHVLLQVFSFLDAPALFRAGLVCKSWLRVAFDELLWKDLFYRHYGIARSIPMAPGKYSWIQEYKRLLYHTPIIESEVLKQHADQVLHVSFSHNGKMFATCSKDGFIRVWDATYPTTLKYKSDMRKFTWKYTQYSQFNSSDTLLLVSGVHFGSLSTSGEIAVFSLEGEFVMQSRVMNKPYDVFGTWYNDFYLLSGNLHWTGHLNSCSAIWLNKAYQETGSEEESVVMRLFKFSNINASSIRTIMIANCLNDGPNESPIATGALPDKGSTASASGSNVSLSSIGEQSANQDEDDKEEVAEMEESENMEPKEENEPESSQKKILQSISVYENGEFVTKYLEVDSDVPNNKINGTIEYSNDYRLAEGPKSRQAKGACGYTSGSEYSTNGNHSGSEVSEKSVNGSQDTFDQSQLLSEIETAGNGCSRPDLEEMQVDFTVPSNSCHDSVTTEQVLLESAGPSCRKDSAKYVNPQSVGSPNICDTNIVLASSRSYETVSVSFELQGTSVDDGHMVLNSESSEGESEGCLSRSSQRSRDEPDQRTGTPKRVLYGQQPAQGDIVCNPSTSDTPDQASNDDLIDELPARSHKIHFCCVDYKKQKKVSPVRNEHERSRIKPCSSNRHARNDGGSLGLHERLDQQSSSDETSVMTDCVPGRSQARLCSHTDETSLDSPVHCMPSLRTRHEHSTGLQSQGGQLHSLGASNRDQSRHVHDSRQTGFENENSNNCVPKVAQSRLCLGSATLSVENVDNQSGIGKNRCLPGGPQCNTPVHVSQSLNQYRSNTAVQTPGRLSIDSGQSLPVPHSQYKFSRNSRKSKSKKIRDKYLIFTKGSETYTPHQIGIKRIKPLRAFSEDGSRLLPNVVDNTYNAEQGETYDEVDHLIDMHGHIIGMSLSPDQRYLYVNSRPWPKNYFIENPLYPPPIAQQIDIHVIDLLNMREVGTMHRSHKAYTSNDECFFIFLDVCEEYVASGAEDKHGYLWDRHYGLCVHKYPHSDVVNSVAFNPTDPEVLVTVSDDFSIKIWRSLGREKEVVKAYNREHSIRLKQIQEMVSDTREYSEHAQVEVHFPPTTDSV